jgi:protein-S-isoprenylcysteine O-methyltransferase Ste14
MYVAYVAILLGLFLDRGELSLVLYAVIWAAVEASWVVWREEPELRRRFGEEYVRYTQQVPRWIPQRLRGVGG